MAELSKTAYEDKLVAIWRTDAEIFSVRDCLELELECIYRALEGHHDDVVWLDRLREYMVYTVSKS